MEGLRTVSIGVLMASLTLTMFDDPVLVTAGTVLRYVAAIVLCLSLLAQQHDSGPGGSDPPLRVTLVAAAVFTLASTAWSIAPLTTLLQSLSWIILCTISFLLAARAWRRRDAFLRDWICIFTILTFFSVSSLALGGVSEATRLTGPFANSNALALVASFAVASGVLVLKCTALLFLRRVVLITLVPLVLVVLLTQSRIALSAVALSIALAILSRAGSSGLLMILIGSVAGFLYWALNLPLPEVRILERFRATRQVGFLNERDVAWNYALDLWSDNPVLGVGFRAGEAAFAANRGRSGSFIYDGAHSSYFQVLLECGIAGVILFGGLVASFLIRGWRYRADPGNFGLLAVGITGLICGLSESALLGLGQVTSWVFWFAAIALLTSAHSPPRPLLQNHVAPSSTLGDLHLGGARTTSRALRTTTTPRNQAASAVKSISPP